MKTILVRPVEILGTCPMNLSLEDEFQIDGLHLISPGEAGICFLAVSHLPPSVWQLQSESRFFAHVSCPGCTQRPENENRVIFLLGHAEKWELCRLISDYRRAIRSSPEPHASQQLRTEAMQAQTDGDFPRATVLMKAALRELKSAR